jgi:hypothetical protein
MNTTDTITEAIEQLKAMLTSRKHGLRKIDGTLIEPEEQNMNLTESVDIAYDTPEAKKMREQFAQELVTLMDATPNRPLVDNDGVRLPTYTGYVIGIDMLRDLYCAYRNCEAVQVCFGLDKPLSQGGQIQLIFRGVGIQPNDEAMNGDASNLFMTGTWGLDQDGNPIGSPTEPVRVRPCPHNGSCQ